VKPKISGFTFLRNAVELGFPFEASLRSLLPIVDELVIAVGRSKDDTLERIRAIGDSKIRIIETVWNERMEQKGFVYAQQKMIAQYACTGDWAFYLEGDEVLHEADHAAILAAVERHDADPEVEALAFDYLHFFGSADWQAITPGWYRRECRMIRNTIRTYAPDGLYWVVMDHNRRGRYPRAALAGARIFHYGHARSVAKMQAKMNQVSKFWSSEAPRITYLQMDPQGLRRFAGKHPSFVKEWIAAECDPDFLPNAKAQLSSKDRKYRVSMKLESWLGVDFSRRHFKLVRS
jgi:hypothetical protein